jgi:tetratricopeptide (TPR) repeat protein
MNACKCWLAVLVVVVLLPNVAASADVAKEAYQKGISSLAKKDYDAAIAAFSEDIRLDPKHANAYVSRGLAYSKTGDVDQAIADYSEAIRLDPKHAIAYYDRGLAYYQQDKAIVGSSEGANDNPSLLRRTPYGDKAIADFSEAIRLNPKHAAAYCDRGLTYWSRHDYDKAIADHTEAIRLDPQFIMAYNNRGIAYADKKEYDKAIADYDQVLRLDPNHALAYANRSLAYRGRGELAKSDADLAQAKRLGYKETPGQITRVPRLIDPKLRTLALVALGVVLAVVLIVVGALIARSLLEKRRPPGPDVVPTKANDW